MSRSVPEWIGKTPDTAIPPRVRLRVFHKYGGICYRAQRKIRPGEPWDAEHIVAIINGGENRESNLAPCLRDKHREKTAEDVALKAQTYKTQKSHWGIRPKSKWPYGKGSKFKKKVNGQVVRRD